MTLAHKIALDSTCKQTNALARAAGYARFAYNWGLNKWKKQYAAGAKPTANSIKKQFNEIKKVEFPWIYESPKDAKLARAISDVGFGRFQQQMQYKSEKFGCTLIVADRWFPSSKRCHMCGNVKEKLNLSERTYVCEAYGLVEDRDVNAAINLEQYPRLVGNLTPVDTRTKARRQRRASSVVEAGTNPCAQVRTI